MLPARLPAPLVLHLHLMRLRLQMQSDALYRRGDGTLSYFFSTAMLQQLAEAAGFEMVECEYACVALRNRRRGASMRRVFVHGVFRRPGAAPTA